MSTVRTQDDVLTNLYQFIALQSAANEKFIWFQKDSIAIQLDKFEKRLSLLTSRKDRRNADKIRSDYLKELNIAYDKYLKATNGILAMLERDDKTSQMIDDMIESLLEFTDEQAKKNIIE